MTSAIVAHVDSVDRLLRRVPNLTRHEREQLRRDVNAVQIARARQLGVTPGLPVAQLAAQGRLVELHDSTEHWVLRDLKFSVPYATPSAQAMLLEIGRRFHTALDSAQAPRFRIEITSVLRTPEKQAELRRRNSNASRIESAHEFGTTVDLAYRRWAPPEPAGPLAEAYSRDWRAAMLYDSLMSKMARDRGAELQALLGRVLAAMQNEGKLMVRMERRQTVFHITVARPLKATQLTWNASQEIELHGAWRIVARRDLATARYDSARDHQRVCTDEDTRAAATVG